MGPFFCWINIGIKLYDIFCACRRALDKAAYVVPRLLGSLTLNSFGFLYVVEPLIRPMSLGVHIGVCKSCCQGTFE
jgi:hypothetical protein